MPAKSAAQQKAAGAALSAKRGDTPKSVQDIYDQGSANHDDANKIAGRIITECGLTPSFALERIKSGA